MITEKSKKIIEKIFNDHKPKGIHKISLEFYQYGSESAIECSITPTYVIEDNDPEGFLKIVQHIKGGGRVYIEREVLFARFQGEMKDFIKRFMNIEFHFSGRSITEKKFWDKQNNSLSLSNN